MAEHALVVGAGVAGLAAALALNVRGLRVTVLDRDEALPDELTPSNSWDWKRGGAPQVRQPHFLMGRLRNLLHAEYPDLVADLFAAGVWELPFHDTVHPVAKASYRPIPADQDMTPLCARRTTLEMVMRRFIDRQGIADIVATCRVDDLIVDHSYATPRVLGCRVTRAGGRSEDILGDIVIDASGRGSNFVTRLRNVGVDIQEEHHRSETVYNTRHYRLRDGQDYPPLNGLPAVDFPDFTLGALPADNRTLTVTLAVWKDDPILEQVRGNAAFFDSICARVPKVRPWVDLDRVEPLSSVISFANMDYLWRCSVVDNVPKVLNFFMVGDSVIRTNPKFGRGCTWGTVSVHHLADIIAAEPDPERRIVSYEKILWTEFREDWQTMYQIEQNSRAKFLAQIGKAPKTLKLRVASYVENHIMNVAMMADAGVQRAIMRGYHGLDGMSDWTRRPDVWFNIALASRPSRTIRALRRANATRPSRAELRTLAERSKPAALPRDQISGVPH